MADTPRHILFELLNALVDGGRLASLSRDELRVLLVLMRHADAGGVAYPSKSLIASRAFGVDAAGKARTWSAARALQSLAARGLLEVVGNAEGGAPGTTARRRLTVPTGSAGATRSAGETGSAGEQDGLRRRTRRVAPAHETGSAGAIQRSQEGHIERHKAPRRAAADDFDLPASLNREDFKGGWERWLKHRREKRAAVKPGSETAKRQLAQCADWGAERSIKAIEHSILNGWTGLFEAKDSNGKRQQRTAEQRGEYAEPGLLAALERITVNPGGDGNGQH